MKTKCTAWSDREWWTYGRREREGPSIWHDGVTCQNVKHTRAGATQFVPCNTCVSAWWVVILISEKTGHWMAHNLLAKPYQHWSCGADCPDGPMSRSEPSQHRCSWTDTSIIHRLHFHERARFHFTILHPPLNRLTDLLSDWSLDITGYLPRSLSCQLFPTTCISATTSTSDLHDNYSLPLPASLAPYLTSPFFLPH